MSRGRVACFKAPTYPRIVELLRLPANRPRILYLDLALLIYKVIGHQQVKRIRIISTSSLMACAKVTKCTSDAKLNRQSDLKKIPWTLSQILEKNPMPMLKLSTFVDVNSGHSVL